jgi:HK97 family phage prohead protease
MEKRIIGAYEIRAAENSKGLSVSGYAARYNVLSHPLPVGNKSFRERIASGAFESVLRRSPDVCCFIGHDQDKILARTTAGTLRLDSDGAGLHFDADIPHTTYGEDLYTNVKAGNINSCSFGFTLGAGDDEWNEEEDETRSRIAVRTINNFSKLFEISLVSNAAYPGTSVSARDREQVAAEVRSFVERLLGPSIPPRHETFKELLERCNGDVDLAAEDMCAHAGIISIARARRIRMQKEILDL